MEARAEAENSEAPLTLRPDDAGLNRQALMSLLQLEGGQVEQGRYNPHAVHLSKHPGPFNGASFQGGLWKAQELFDRAKARGLTARITSPSASTSQSSATSGSICKVSPGPASDSVSAEMG